MGTAWPPLQRVPHLSRPHALLQRRGSESRGQPGGSPADPGSLGLLQAPKLCVRGQHPPLWASAASFARLFGGTGQGGSASRCQASPEIAVPSRPPGSLAERSLAGPQGAGGYFGRGLRGQVRALSRGSRSPSDVRPPGPWPAAWPRHVRPFLCLPPLPPIPPPSAPGGQGRDFRE